MHDVAGHRLAVGIHEFDPEPSEPALDGPREVLDRRVVRHAQIHHRVLIHGRPVGEVERAGLDQELVPGRVDRDGDDGVTDRSGPQESRSGEQRAPHQHVMLRVESRTAVAALRDYRPSGKLRAFTVRDRRGQRNI
jgi:hypothetical protein